MDAWYDWADAENRSQFYRGLTPGEAALLKSVNQDREDSNDAINNMLIAGGATTENALAARKASNERFDKFQGQLLEADAARRDRLDAQRMQLRQQRAGNTANNYLQAAQDWNQWGQQTAGSILSLGSTGLLNGAGAAAGAAGINPVDVAGSGANVFNTAVADSLSPSINYAPIPKASALGGLR